MEISERIQQLRKATGYSQEKLAELLHVSRQAISKWESGTTLPTIDNLTELSKIFHISISELLQGQEADNDHTVEAASYEQRSSEEDNLISLESLKLILHENEERILRKDKSFRSLLAGLGFVFAAIIIILVVIISNRMNNLNRQVDSLSTQMSSLQFTASLNNQGSYVYTPEQEENLLVSDYSYEIVNYDTATRQVTITVTATPKVYTDNMTAIFTASANDMETVTMDGILSNSNIFSCTMTFPVMDEIKLSVSFKDGSQIQSELLETIYDLKGKYSMKADSVFNGTCNIIDSVLTLSGQVVTSVIPANSGANSYINNWPLSGTVQIVIDNEVAREFPIDLSLFLDIYEAGAGPTEVINGNGTVDAMLESEYYFYTDINDDIVLPDSGKAEMRIQLIDNYGTETTQTLALP